jgi:excisionase family DNA binding protein
MSLSRTRVVAAKGLNPSPLFLFAARPNEGIAAMSKKKQKRAHLPKPRGVQRLAYDLREVAERLSVSPRTVANMLADGTLASVKIRKTRRVPHAELVRLLAEGSAAVEASDRT